MNRIGTSNIFRFLFWFLVAAVLIALLMPCDSHSHSPISRVRSDIRSLATALEAYYIDNGEYPAMDPLSNVVESPADIQEIGGGKLSTVYRGGNNMEGITTPVAYITSLRIFSDPWSGKEQWVPFAYYATPPKEDEQQEWILFSAGPDLKYDLTDPAILFSDSAELSTPTLLLYSYDPTNGTVSSGDVLRVRAHSERF